MAHPDIFGIESLDDTARHELMRKHLQNLITSYADEADVFTELIQNGIDAIVSRQAVESTYVGELTICVGRRSANSHFVYVQDDGVGMNQATVDKVFIPGFSMGKKPGFSIGHKGVGLSYVVAVSEHLAISSKRSQLDAVARTVRYTNSWVNDSEKPMPEVSDEFSVPSIVSQLEEPLSQGTGV